MVIIIFNILIILVLLILLSFIFWYPIIPLTTDQVILTKFFSYINFGWVIFELRKKSNYSCKIQFEYNGSIFPSSQDIFNIYDIINKV